VPSDQLDERIRDRVGGLIGDADAVADAFVELIGRHRVWTRGHLASVPA
jgi:hypothetical protein